MEKKMLPMFMEAELPNNRKIHVVKLTLIQMGFFAPQQLGVVQRKALDMGLRKFNLEELKAFRKAYNTQEVGEHLMVLVVDGESNMLLLENHAIEGLGIAPHHSRHDSMWRPDDTFCFLK